MVNGVRNARAWHALLGVEKTVIEDVEVDEVDQVLVGGSAPLGGPLVPDHAAVRGLPTFGVSARGPPGSRIRCDPTNPATGRSRCPFLRADSAGRPVPCARWRSRPARSSRIRSWAAARRERLRGVCCPASRDATTVTAQRLSRDPVSYTHLRAHETDSYL